MNREDILQEFCQKYSDSLEEEIICIKKGNIKWIDAVNGQFIAYSNGFYVYSFEVDFELNYPMEIDATIKYYGEHIEGLLIAVDGFDVILGMKEFLGENVEKVNFSTDTWKILEKLIEHVEKIINEKTAKLATTLITNAKNKKLYNEQLNTGQNLAISMALNQPITFIWGPPGTGKTETLAKIALKNIEKGKRVLVLSYSNVAVDGAVKRLLKLNEKKYDNKIVRYGYIRDKDLAVNDKISVEKIVLRNNPQLYDEMKKLEGDMAKFRAVKIIDSRKLEIQQKISQIKEQLKEEEKKLVRKALFVATTISKAIVDKTIYEDAYDVVICDEVSMAYVPQIVFAASIAKNNFICLGDFEQLPPIVQSNEKNLLNVDIFRYCGIADCVEKHKGHRWLCLLNKQYRMYPEIANFISHNMYFSLLTSSKETEEKNLEIIKEYPFKNKSVAIADISEILANCSSTIDSSRVNLISALFAISLAIKCNNNEVAIITPYSEQAKILKALAKDVQEKFANKPPIICSTVHQFQGSEKDIVIYDAVDNYTQQSLGLMFSSRENGFSNRLFNVAISRAKSKFILVVNFDYFMDRRISPDLLFAKFLNEYADDIQNGDYLIHIESQGVNKVMKWYYIFWEKDFINDVINAKKEIIIDIPGRIEEDVSLEILNALQQAKSKKVNVVIRTKDKTSLPKGLQQFAVNNQYAINSLSIIDKRIIWSGIPKCQNEIKDDEKIIDIKYNPIMRFEGENAAKAFYKEGIMDDKNEYGTKMLNDNDEKITFAKFVEDTIKCKVCGEKMHLTYGRYGSYLACSNANCDAKKKIYMYMVEEYLYKYPNKSICPLCGMPLTVRQGSKEIFLKCKANQEHIFFLNQI